MSVKSWPLYNKLVLPYHFLQAVVAGVRYGFPARKLRVIGVTGTNGKTTTCFMIWKMLNESGRKAGLMTTVAWGVDKLENQVEHMTTVDSMTLNRRIKAIKEAGAEYLVLEVTSHAMVQFRTLGIPVEIAVMTNVTHDHLDYHRTFGNYVAAKCKLFAKAKYGVINVDDKSSYKFAQAIMKGKDRRHAMQSYITYGIKDGKKRAMGVKLGVSGVNYSCGDIKVKTQIPGKFNVYNSLAAVCVGQKLGLKNAEIEKGIYALASVEGRMNRVNLGQEYEVIVDYAHTPDAFLKVYESVKAPAKKGRIISLSGGAGQRDQSTREERGEIMAKYSDICVLTEDDSRDEDPREIMTSFKEGCLKAGMKEEQIIEVVDRREAIEKAISLAKKGDLVLILGKGHEKTILRADGAHEFEDLKEAKRAIRLANRRIAKARA